MKSFIVTILISILFSGCNIFNPTHEIDTEFVITDTRGFESRVFHSGQDFNMKLTLTNNTGKDQEYYYYGIPIIFEIIKNDSVITSSVHGLDWVSRTLEGTFEKDTEITSSWRAPTPSYASFLTILEPGQYIARARITMTFKNYEDIQPRVKVIRIIE